MLSNNNAKGFTLIEIMMVVAIIGILAVLAIPNFIGYRDRAYCSAAEADARAVAAAVAEYFSVPSHTGVPAVSDLNLAGLSNGNTYLIESTDPDVMLVIKIVTTNRCPLEHQNASLQADPNATGWDGAGSYFFSIRNNL